MNKGFVELDKLIESSHTILIIQADNPDGDSLASALALEQILGDLGKEPMLYCGIDMPDNVKYIDGWDRVSKDIPRSFDMSIIVDCAFESLLEQMKKQPTFNSIKNKPFVIIDHHKTEVSIGFSSLIIIEENASATSEILYDIALNLGWPISKDTAELFAASILADTLGLTTQKLDDNSKPIRIIADLVDRGASLSRISDKRLRQLQYDVETLRYKATLLQRIEFHNDNSIATITIPYSEVVKYSQSYNPTVVLDEMRMVRGVAVSIGFKLYESRGNLVRLTARIRCNRGFGIAQKLAEHFGGGGHEYASGFKIERTPLDFNGIYQEVVATATKLLKESRNA